MAISSRTGCAPIVPSGTTRLASQPVDLRNVRITGGVWARWQRANREVSFPLGMKRVETEGNIPNLRMAAGLEQGEYKTPMFMDGAIYKMLEAAAWEIAREPYPELEAFVVEMTELLGQVQQEDGYLNSYIQVVEPDQRYQRIDRSHEIYLAGLLVLAGIAADRAGLGDRLLGIGRRFADQIAEAFIGTPGGGADGHPGAEFAMVELYRHTGEQRYLDLAACMIEGRGHGALGGKHGGLRYFQDHLPVREAPTVVGHAVRAMYLDAGVLDLYLETGDDSLLESSIRRWDDMVATKMSITGGIGSRHRGEAFGDGYELPPDRAYNESCAAFAAIFWNWRMLLATGESRYADLIERLLYNAFAASTSIDGSRFFYVNPLQRRPDHYEADDPGRRHEWYSCPCCPPNIMRLVSSLGYYVATTAPDAVQIHQFMPATLAVELNAGRVSIDIETDYPWAGEVRLIIREAPEEAWSLDIRVPGWCSSGSAVIVGEQPIPVGSDTGYLSQRRIWRPGDTVVLSLDMPVRVMQPHHRIDALRGCVALERGPLVYCFEQIDQSAPLADLTIDAASAARVVQHENLTGIGRTATIEVAGHLLAPVAGQGLPYRVLETNQQQPLSAAMMAAIPYFQWDNRDPGGMRVWLPTSSDHAG